VTSPRVRDARYPLGGSTGPGPGPGPGPRLRPSAGPGPTTTKKQKNETLHSRDGDEFDVKV
jgi:hypothetical protein